MKRPLAAATLLLSAAAASAQFEGEADFKITTFGEKGQLDGRARMWTAKNGFRMEWETSTDAGGGKRGTPPSVKMVLVAPLPDPEKVYMINDANRTYSVWDTRRAREQMKSVPKDTYTVQKLGTERVAGYSCQNARVTSSKGSDFEVCIAGEFGPSTDWVSAFNARDPATRSWFKALREAGIEGFPVRWSVSEKGSAHPTVVMELTRAQKKAVSASLFQVPASYTQTDFAMGGLTPEQEKAMGEARQKMKEALEKMTPEQRKQYEEMMRRSGRPTPAP